MGQNESGAKKDTIKDFAKAYNNLVRTNFYDKSMIAQADIERAEKARQPKPTLEQVAARLWACHDKHLERVEECRKRVEEERFKKGNDLDTVTEECKFHPEIYSRYVEDQYRTQEEFVAAKQEYLFKKNERL